MKLGAISFMTDYSIPPAEVASELEAHGFDFFGRVTIPTSRHQPTRAGRCWIRVPTSRCKPSTGT